MHAFDSLVLTCIGVHQRVQTVWFSGVSRHHRRVADVIKGLRRERGLGLATDIIDQRGSDEVQVVGLDDVADPPVQVLEVGLVVGLFEAKKKMLAYSD